MLYNWWTSTSPELRARSVPADGTILAKQVWWCDSSLLLLMMPGTCVDRMMNAYKVKEEMRGSRWFIEVLHWQLVQSSHHHFLLRSTSETTENNYNSAGIQYMTVPCHACNMFIALAILLYWYAEGSHKQRSTFQLEHPKWSWYALSNAPMIILVMILHPLPPLHLLFTKGEFHIHCKD